MGSHIEKFHSHLHHLVQHTTQVPKGFLRHKTLELLGEKSMSGSEIADEIERRTAGQWRPGPGSIYPLLAWLAKNGYAIKQPVEKTGIKRYILTEAGRQFLEEGNILSAEPEQKVRAAAPCLMDILWFNGHDEMAWELHKSMIGLISAFSDFNAIMNRKLSENAITDAKRVVDEAIKKIEAINQSLKKLDS
jgi:DNA-binding PadR family transcriptional regulator